MSKLENGVIKLFPAPGTIRDNSHVRYNGEIYTVSKRDGNKLLLDSDETIQSSEAMLLKYMVILKGKIAELHQDDYDKVYNGYEGLVEVNSILSTAYKGDIVSLIKYNSDMGIMPIKPINGIIDDVEPPFYVIELDDARRVKVRRHFFKSISKINYKYLARINVQQKDTNT